MALQARPADTSPEVWALYRAQWKDRTPAERLEDVSAMTEDLTSLVLDGIRAFHPDWSDEQVQFELARRRYGREIAEIAFSRSAAS